MPILLFRYFNLALLTSVSKDLVDTKQGKCLFFTGEGVKYVLLALHFVVGNKYTNKHDF